MLAKKVVFVATGQRVVDSGGVIRIVAFQVNGDVYAYGRTGQVEKIEVRYDAWGGEPDLALGLAA